MALKKIIDKVKKEVKVLEGEVAKDKTYTNQNSYSDENTAKAHFQLSKKKLFDVNSWTNMEGMASTFTLYDANGNPSAAKKPVVGSYIKIVLPASNVENWVQVTAVRVEDDMAEFVVHPSNKPPKLQDNPDEVKHFFAKEASSTFRVERQGSTLIASEIGKEEKINNRGDEAGDRALLNTVVAEGGWMHVQQIHWDNLTKYLTHINGPNQHP